MEAGGPTRRASDLDQARGYRTCDSLGIAAMLRSKLFLRIFLAMIALAVGLAVALSGAIMLRTQRDIQARELQIVESYRDTVKGSLERWLDSRVLDTKGVAREIEFAALTGSDLRSVWKRFEALTQPDSAYTDYFLVEPSGTVYASRAESITRMVDLSDRDYVKEGLAGRPFVSGLFQGRLVGSPIFAISHPVSVRGQTWVVVGIVSLKNLSSIVDTLNLSDLGTAILIDARLRIVSKPEYIEAYVTSELEGDAHVLSGDAADLVASGVPGARLYTDHRGVLVAGAWGYLERLSLTLLVELDNERAMKPLVSLQRFIALISILATLVFSVAAYVLTAGIVKPIAAFVAAAKGVKENRYRNSIELRTGTELDELAEAFNQMALAVREREEGLRESASRDSLTGLYNHGAIEEFLAEELRLKARTGDPVCFVMADIDHFKRVNDTYGHQAGDDALIGVVALMSSALREGDVLGRYGGEEFAIILNARKADEAERFCQRLRVAIEAAVFRCDGHELRLTVSLGYAFVPAIDGEPFDIVRRADRALYEAKNAGRNAVRRG